MEKFLEFLKRINVGLRAALGAVCAFFMAALTAVVLWGVATRYLFGEQPAFTEEFARMFLIVVTFFGGAFAFSDGSHIGLDYLASKFSPSGKRFCAVFSAAASLFFAIAVLVYGGTAFIVTSMKSSNMLVSAPVPQWSIYLCIPMCGLFSMSFLMESVLRAICGGIKFEPSKNSEQGGKL